MEVIQGNSESYGQTSEGCQWYNMEQKMQNNCFITLKKLWHFTAFSEHEQIINIERLYQLLLIIVNKNQRFQSWSIVHFEFYIMFNTNAW
jgi:hypothetical protein